MTNSNAKYALKTDGEISLDIKAPRTAPGTEKHAIFRPILYLILLCLAYSITDEILVEVTAIRLVLAIWEGVKPIKVRTGAITIPPPIPIMEPRVPAANPTKNIIIAPSKANIFHFNNVYFNTINLWYCITPNTHSLLKPSI